MSSYYIDGLTRGVRIDERGIRLNLDPRYLSNRIMVDLSPMSSSLFTPALASASARICSNSYPSIHSRSGPDTSSLFCVSNNTLENLALNSQVIWLQPPFFWMGAPQFLCGHSFARLLTASSLASSSFLRSSRFFWPLVRYSYSSQVSSSSCSPSWTTQRLWRHSTQEFIAHLFNIVYLSRRASFGSAPAEARIGAEHVASLDKVVPLEDIVAGVCFDLLISQTDFARSSGAFDFLPAVLLQLRAESGSVAVSANISVVSARRQGRKVDDKFWVATDCTVPCTRC